MRKWTTTGSAGQAAAHAQVLAELIAQLGQPALRSTLLPALQPLVPAASFSVYRTGRGCKPQLYLSGALGVPDTTRDCWRAYLSGPYREDRTLTDEALPADRLLLCHITAEEMPPQHRARVYEAHGMAERVSVAQADGTAIFAVNFYRHRHQPPFSDSQVAEFEALAPSLLALARKHVALTAPTSPSMPQADTRSRLQALQPTLTPRELDVCERLLAGMTYDGIACDLGLTVPSVKTYRNRAFARLGIHFRNELYALLLDGAAGARPRRFQA